MYYIKRVVGETVLTYDELYTLLTRIEACLNSRPLVPMSNDPDVLTAITPIVYFFLVGACVRIYKILQRNATFLLVTLFFYLH
jgi:hypothetical protein